MLSFLALILLTKLLVVQFNTLRSSVKHDWLCHACTFKINLLLQMALILGLCSKNAVVAQKTILSCLAE